MNTLIGLAPPPVAPPFPSASLDEAPPRPTAPPVRGFPPFADPLLLLADFPPAVAPPTLVAPATDFPPLAAPPFGTPEVGALPPAELRVARLDSFSVPPFDTRVSE